MVDLPLDHFQLMLFGSIRAFCATSLSSMTCTSRLCRNSAICVNGISSTQVPDCVQHLELLGTVIPVPGARVDIFGFQQAATLIMPKRAQRHIEHICNLAYTGTVCRHPAKRRALHFAHSPSCTRLLRNYAVTLEPRVEAKQISTESSDPAGAATPMGNKVFGNSLDAGCAPGTRTRVMATILWMNPI